MKNAYLLLAVVGAVIPMLFFIDFFSASGFGLMGFIEALFVNGATSGFTADLLISSAVFWTYMFANKDGPRPPVFILLNLCIGLSCALPAYLYVSLKRQEALTA